MRVLIAALIVVFPLTSTGQQGGRSGARFHFVGFTGATFTGERGIRTYTEACQDAFTASARMCTSVEVLDTVAWPVVPSSTRGWVRPVYQPVMGALTDASGVVAASPTAGSLSCGGWSFATATAHGLAVSGDGRFATPGFVDTCDTARPIACCAPVPG